MKKSVAITTVLALHVAVISMLLIQAGCSSEPAEPAAVTAKTSVENVSEIEVSGDVNDGIKDDLGKDEMIQPPEGSPALRSDPTRPAVNISDEKEPETVVKPADVPEPVPQVDAAAQKKEVIYEVKKGDSLGRVAKKHKITVSELAGANGLSNTATLKIGQKLMIPASVQVPPQENKEGSIQPPAATTSAADTTVYIVKRGDSLSKIAKKYGTTVKNLMTINSLKSHNIKIGQKLNVPNKPTSVVNAAESAKNAADGEIIHIVKSGETLGGIAIKYGSTVRAISERNNISDPRKIMAGQRLIIKGKAKDSQQSKDAGKISVPQQIPQQTQVIPSKTQAEAPSIKISPDSPKVQAETPQQETGTKVETPAQEQKANTVSPAPTAPSGNQNNAPATTESSDVIVL